MRPFSGVAVRRFFAVFCLAFLTLWPLGAAEGPDLALLADRLRDAEKSVQSEDARAVIRNARRALDHATEKSEAGDRAAAEEELQTARASLAKATALISNESETVQAAVRAASDALNAAAAEPPLSVTRQEVQTSAGLHVVTFDTLQGTVTVNLPDDMAAGDTISGTVVAEAKGATPEVQKKNQDTLSGTVVEMEQQKTAVSDPGGRGRWVLPTAAAVAIPLILRDRQGRTIGRVNVPVAKPSDPIARVTEKEKAQFQLPSGGQTGRPFEVTGPFDGDSSTSSVSLGGKPVDVLAESPRKLIGRAPVDTVGVSTLEVTKQSFVTRCEYRNLNVKLAAPKLDLKSGEHTTMTITVDGAEGMERSVPLSVVNESPAVVHIDSGDKQSLEVDPRKLTGRSFVVTRGLTGVVPGGFRITASIMPGSMPPARCTTSDDGSKVSADGADAKRARPPGSDVPTAEVYRPPATIAYADDPERLRNAAVDVFTGARWRELTPGNTLEVFRDNPPMTGVVDLEANTFGVLPPQNVSAYWRSIAQLNVWRNVDYFFAGSDRNTFTDSENDGLLGVALAGAGPREGAPARVRWHTNGLQLQPGVPLELWLVRRATDGEPRRVPGASGTLRLDPGTIIAGIAVAIITEDGVTPPVVDQAMASLWFDGRTAGRIPPVNARDITLGSIQTVLDRDPHPSWTPAHLDAPNDGRRLASMGQEVDGIWSYCGLHYGRNIQFRMVRFARVAAASGGASCAQAAAQGRRDILPGCIQRWGEELQRLTGDHRPAITVAVATAYPTTGVAQSWQQGALVSQEALSGGYGRFTVAHELGHVLGWGNVLFNDGVVRDNLMSFSAEGTLTREQCEYAYHNAAAYAVTGR